MNVKTPNRRSILVLATGALAVPLALFASTSPTAKPDYTRDIAPMLKARCGSCHTGDESPAGLVITDPKSLAKVIVPGHPERSILVERLLGHGGKPRMPMRFAPLGDEDMAKVKAWILAGADMRTSNAVHWAYAAIKRPTVPGGDPNAIDAFIRQRITQEGLKPSKEASKQTLIRRASLVLTGLPPTPQELDAFERDSRPDAYDRLVDRLLASPAYGERMAQKWLDLARYADSDGYEKDLNRTAWKYRDWVIDAFNRNEPYDQFVVDQVAGDLLPQPSLNQLIATGFNRNTMLNLEGGVDQAEAHFDVILDRVSTTGTVFLGSTIGCARCHDHKYDPFTQKDFYAMAAFYNNAVIEPQGNKATSEEKWYEPFLPAPSPAQAALQATLIKRLAMDDAAVATAAKNLSAERAAWIREADRFAPTILSGQATVPPGKAGTTLPDLSVLIPGYGPEKATYDFTAAIPAGRWTGLRLEAMPDDSLPGHGPGMSDNGNFVLSKIDVSVNGSAIPMSAARADFAQQGFAPEGAFDNDPNTGWAIVPQTGQAHSAIYTFAKPLETTGTMLVKLAMDSKYPNHTLGRFRVSLTTEPDPERFAIPADVQTELKSDPSSDKVTKFFETVSPTLRILRIVADKDRAELAKLQREIPTALVMRDKPNVPVLKTNVRIRGDFLNPGVEVTARTPKFLCEMPKYAPGNRLGLGKWLVSPLNPLTARVEVNRLWEMCFGRGLVETAEDFGTQGSPPTHPEILDWLASELMRNHWNLKATLKLIVTSKTFRQDSASSPTLESKDAENRWLARGPRYRLEAEMIRDATLAEGGLLDNKVGGPSVYPQQPAGVWNTPYNGEAWMTSPGNEKFRRGLYTFWKRTSPYPEFTAFDATSREECTARRIRTNTPLQALTMLNDEVVMTAARGLAHRMEFASGSDAGKLTHGFRCVLSRSPSAQELQRLQKLLSTLTAKYRANPSEAKKLKAATPEEAAWTLVANVLLNLDEALNLQ